MNVIFVDEKFPLIGHIAFGIIDRGTNVLQIRPTTVCHMNCIYCSVDAGPKTRHRLNEFIVKLDWLLEWVKVVAYFKEVELEALIDGVGDPLTYPKITELVRELKKIPNIKIVSLETRGYLLNEEVIKKLESVGLDRINLSLDTLNKPKACFLQGVTSELYDVNKIKELCEFIVKETTIDLHITPVWLPNINDDDIKEIIKWCIKIGCGKKYPPLGIQKYVHHKYGRHPKGVKEISWREFYLKLKSLEKVYGIKLILKPSDFGIKRAKKIPIIFNVNDIIDVEIISEGWLKGEYIGRDLKRRRVITVVGGKNLEIGAVISVRIVRNKDNIYVATTKP